MATLDGAGAAFDLADQMALISSELMRFRIQNQARLKPDEKTNLERLEGELNQATAQARAAGITALGTLTASARAELQDATAQAQAFLTKVKNVEKAVGVATALIGLAVAVSTGNPAGILKAARGVKSAVAVAPAAPGTKAAG